MKVDTNKSNFINLVDYNNKILEIVKKQVKLVFENDLLLEADYKKKILEKFPIPDSAAEYVSNRMGKLSLWFLNAVMKSDFDTKEDFINYIKERPFWIRTNFDSAMTNILDWIRHPLVAGTVDLRNLTLQDAIDKANEFHENLKELGGKIDYKEDNKKLVQYDNGFYWAKIPSNYSAEECERMGHCGRTSKGDMLFSLRSELSYGKGHTINDSHLTVAYNSVNGLIYQSKGKKNAKPSQKYFPYFFDLILRLPKFNGFGSEYQSSQDISFEDFSVEQLKELMQKFPDAFKSYKAQKILFEKGLIPKIEAQGKMILKLDVGDISSYLNIDRNLSDSIIKRILVDPYDLYYNDYEGTWQYVVDDINNENKKTILDFIEKNHPDIDISSGDLEEIISENSEELDEVITAINRAATDAENDAYANYCYKELKSTLEYWGTVQILNDEGALIEVDIDNFFDDIDQEYIEDAMEKCDDDRECAFHELAAEGRIERPRFYLDDRYSPSIDKEYFNSYLVDSLDTELV